MTTGSTSAEGDPFPLHSVQAVAALSWRLTLASDPIGLLVLPFVMFFPVYVFVTLLAEIARDLKNLALERASPEAVAAAVPMGAILGVLPLVIFAYAFGEAWIQVRSDALARSERPGYGATFTRALGRVWPLALVTLVVYALFQVAAFALVFPGVVVAVLTSFATQAAVLGSVGVVDALRKSRDLVVRHWAAWLGMVTYWTILFLGLGILVGIVRTSAAEVAGARARFLVDLAFGLPLPIALLVFKTCWTLFYRELEGRTQSAAAPVAQTALVVALLAVVAVAPPDVSAAVSSTAVATSSFPLPVSGESRTVLLVRDGRVYAAWSEAEGAIPGARARLHAASGEVLDTLEVEWVRDAVTALRAMDDGGRRVARDAAPSTVAGLWIEPLGRAARAPHGRLVVPLGALPSTLDPALATSLAEKQVTSQMFEGLVRLGPHLEPVPAAADSFVQAGRRYRFHLRADARFHDGRAVRARDVRATLERALASGFAAPRVEGLADAIAGGADYHAGRARAITGIAIVDSSTIEIMASRERAPLLAELAAPAAFLVPVERAGALEAEPSFARAPIGSGPFRFERADTAGVWLVAAPGRAGGPDTLVLHRVDSPRSAVLDFELGRLDVVAPPETDERRILAAGRLRPEVLHLDEASTYYLGFNTKKPFLLDREHRRALAGALDRALAVRVLVPGRGRLAEGLLPPAFGVQGAVGSWLPPLAEAQARARAFSAGAPELSLWLPAGSPTGLRLAEFAAAAYRRLGYRVTILERPWAEFERAVGDGRADLFYLSWFADGPDPIAFVASLVESRRRGAGGNRTLYANAAVDSALAVARRAPTPQAAAAALRRAERIALEDAPLVPLFHSVNVTLVRPGVHGLVLDPLGAPRYDAVEVDDGR